MFIDYSLRDQLYPDLAGDPLAFVLGLSISRILAIRIFGLAISEYSVIRVWLGCGYGVTTLG